MDWRKWKFNYKLVKREFWIIVAFFLLVPLILCKSCICAEKGKTAFEEAIEEYQSLTGRKIYPAGRRCLEKACKDCKTKGDCLIIIAKEMNNFK